MKVAEKSSGGFDVFDLLWAELHDAGSSGVDGNGIVADNQNTASLGLTLNGAVSFHAHNAVNNGEVGADGGVEVEDGLVDARPVENILWPAIAASRNHSEHVF